VARGRRPGDRSAVCARGVLHLRPFRPPESPHDYFTAVFAEQAEAECRFGEPIAAGELAAVDWWAAIVSRDGSGETLAGVSYLRFGPDGLVVRQRDVWESQPGRCELLEWAR
jgi:hypothetical protein